MVVRGRTQGPLHLPSLLGRPRISESQNNCDANGGCGVFGRVESVKTHTGVEGARADHPVRDNHKSQDPGPHVDTSYSWFEGWEYPESILPSPSAVWFSHYGPRVHSYPFVRRASGSLSPNRWSARRPSPCLDDGLRERGT